MLSGTAVLLAVLGGLYQWKGWTPGSVYRKLTSGWRMRSGKGAQAAKEEFEDRILEMPLPDQSIEVNRQVPDGEGGTTQTTDTYEPEEYRKRVSRMVQDTVMSAYHAGKNEGLLRADNEDRHFKMTMMALFVSFGNLLALLVLLSELGVLNF